MRAHRELAAGVLAALLGLGCGRLAGLEDLVFADGPGAGGAQNGGGAGGAGASEGGSDGGGGAGPMMPCGAIGALRDDFEDGLPGAAWKVTMDAGTSVGEQGGVLSFKMPTDLTVAEAVYETHYRYDMRGGEVAVEVTKMLDTAKDGLAYLRVTADDLNWLAFEQQLGKLHLVARVGGTDIEPVPALTYVPDAHRWWRIRDEGGMVSWELSANGTEWTTAASVATSSLKSLAYVSVSLGANAFGNAADLGGVELDNLNTGTPAAALCDAGAFHDDFEDGLHDPDWGRGTGDAAISVGELGGELRLTLAPNRADSVWLERTARAFDFTGQTLTALLSGPPSNAESWALVGIQSLDSQGATSEVELYVHDGQLALRATVGSDVQEEHGGAFTPATQHYLRLTEDGGHVSSSTSADGRSWQPHETVDLPFPATTVGLYLGAATWLAVPSPGDVRFGSLNTLP